MAPIKGRSAVRHARLQARQPVFPVPARRSDASLSVAAASRRSSATSHSVPATWHSHRTGTGAGTPGGRSAGRRVRRDNAAAPTKRPFSGISPQGSLNRER